MSTSDWYEKASKLSDAPGVYLMWNKNREAIYIGKAKNLRNRVRSYFQVGSSDNRAFISLLDSELSDLETVITSNEKEALILERELIKKHRPRFNIIWKDDKQYLCLRIDTSHEYPRVEVVRNTQNDKARYFGPFHSASAARQTLRVVNRHFQLRTCRDSVLYHRTRPCLEYQIGRCPGPCVFPVDREKYKENVQNVILFLEGKSEELVDKLNARMWASSEQLEFEAASHYRNQIRAVERTRVRQNIALEDHLDADAIGLFKDGNRFCLTLVEVRRGRVQNITADIHSGAPLNDQDAIESYLLDRYRAPDVMGKRRSKWKILLSRELELPALIEELLEDKYGRPFEIKVPKRGELSSLVSLASRNAEHAFRERVSSSEDDRDEVLIRMRTALQLKNVPTRMECFDISNLGSNAIVGSKVRFHRGLPDKSGYRHFRVKSVVGQNDFASMYEVLSRRLKRGKEEGDLPDLIVIDGGKGQLSSAEAAFRDVGIEDVDLISLAKSRILQNGTSTDNYEDNEIQRSAERVFVPKFKDPIVFPKDAKEILLLARIRDEAHRFAITYHRKLRGKPGTPKKPMKSVGPATRKMLLRVFGDWDKVRAASVTDLSKVQGIGAKRASLIWEALQQTCEKFEK